MSSTRNEECSNERTQLIYYLNIHYNDNGLPPFLLCPGSHVLILTRSGAKGLGLGVLRAFLHDQTVSFSWPCNETAIYPGEAKGARGDTLFEKYGGQVLIALVSVEAKKWIRPSMYSQILLGTRHCCSQEPSTSGKKDRGRPPGWAGKIGLEGADDQGSEINVRHLVPERDFQDGLCHHHHHYHHPPPW